MLKKILFVVLIIIVIFGAWRLMRHASQSSKKTSQQQASFNKSLYPTDKPGSIWWIVNKKRPLSQDYAPDDLVAPNVTQRLSGGDETQVSQKAAKPLEDLVNDAGRADLSLMLVSGYRSYALQVTVYNQNLSQLGQTEADRISAHPGTSEHQTGLAVDLGRTDRQCELEACFADTAEGKWLAAHAYEYGFIIRYQKGKEATTGYQYEPWHFRYVGKELAAELHRTNQTMEEFFGL